MALRRSERLNSNFNSNNVQNQLSSSPIPFISETENSPPDEEDNNQFLYQEVQQHRYFNSPEIKTLIQKESENETLAEKETVSVTPPNAESPAENVSATTKALYQMEVEETEKKGCKRPGKSPMAVKRKKLNQRLSKLLMPKSALILLHELKPGCVYRVQEQPGSFPSYFCAQVELNNKVLGIGQGLSKSLAKNCAAENAIKTIVSKIMSRRPYQTEGEETKEESVEESMEDTPENLPWAGLASFAIYKMFTEWQAQGTDVIPMARPIVKPKSKPPPVNNTAAKKELPPNAAELHPAVVLNLMNPGLTAVEVERENGPKCRVKMAYTIDDRTFTGIGGNKKDAKKEAAKAVLEGLYGLNYP